MATIKEALDAISGGTHRHIVNISGGKDSAALAVYLRQNYPQIPAEYVFSDTGCELPETYEYLTRLESVLDSEIHRISALDVLGIRKKCRNPFDIYLNEVYGGFLPNPRSRWCTRVLKIQPWEAFMGTDSVFSYIAIRGDENRQGYAGIKRPVLSNKPTVIPVYPFMDDMIGLSGVLNILHTTGLGMPDYYKWRSRSGCYFCFYQQIGEWQNLHDLHPDLFDKALKYEKVIGAKTYTWIDGKSIAEIVAAPRRPVFQASEGCAICHL